MAKDVYRDVHSFLCVNGTWRVTMVQHTMMAFDADLRELRAAIIEMGTRIQKQLTEAVNALVEGNVEFAHEVRAADVAIDALQHEIEAKAIGTIARRQPFAGDLREIVGALRIAIDLERIGDLAANIAKRAEQIGDEKWANEITVQLRHMTERVLEQLRRVIESYEHRDLAEALEVWRSDQDVDAPSNHSVAYCLCQFWADCTTNTSESSFR
jgi:phosphate transport system protein